MSQQILTDTERAFERSFPSAHAAKSIYEEQEFHRAVEAYRFFYPSLSMEALCNGLRELGIEDGEALALLLPGPRHRALTASSDMPNVIGVLDLEVMGPVVVEIPPGFFMGLIADHHHRWITDLGLPGPDAGKGGKYLLLPPGLVEEIPAGYHLGGSATNKAVLALRALPTGGDLGRALHALRQVKVYPLQMPKAVLPFIDISDQDFDASPVRWEDNLEYWQRLHEVIDTEPMIEDFQPMYGQLAVLGIERGRPFSPTSRQRRILEAAARDGIDEMRVEGFASQRADRFVWRDRRWEWVGLVPDHPHFATQGVLDLEARDRWFFQMAVTSPTLSRKQMRAGTLHLLSARDQNGTYLDGGGSYRLIVPQPVPARWLWSVTVYDAKTRSQLRTAQDKAALNSLRDPLDAAANSVLELYFGPTAPPGKERHWLQTKPGVGFFLYFRLYGPEAASLDGPWRPSDLLRLDAPQLDLQQLDPLQSHPPQTHPLQSHPLQSHPLQGARTSSAPEQSTVLIGSRSPSEVMSVDLDARRTGMSFQRTRMSADRTLLSVIRTAIPLIAFGFTIFQFFKKLREADVLSGAAHGAHNFGIALVMAGVVMLVVGISHHLFLAAELRKARREMSLAGLILGQTAFHSSIMLIGAVLVLAIGVAAAASMLAGWGLFD